MKKYLFKRIISSIFSLLAVVAAVMLLVYTLIDRNVIFQTDDIWNKKSGNDRTIYEYTQYEKFGYLEYFNYTQFLGKKYNEKYGSSYSTREDYLADKDVIQNKKSYMNNQSVKDFIKYYQDELHYEIVYLEPLTYNSGKLKTGGTAYLIAVNEKSVLSRLFSYISNLVTIETVNDVSDETLTDRYIRFEKDPYSNAFALVGSGTNHKYLLYFDNRFPFIHQNFIHLNLGVSFTRYRNQEITSVINQSQGDLLNVRTQYPALIGTDQYTETSIDFHSLTYNYGILTADEQERYPDKYTVYSYQRDGLSMLENSFVMGIISTLIAYLIGLPIGMLMARKKDQLADKLGNAYIIFIMAVPSLAYIYLFAAIGTMIFHLPYKFANAEVKIMAYILPTISLALPSIGSLMKWMRRYMIDQMNSDYVKFARAEGLSEAEIFSKHIAKNAFIPLVHGIPGNILGCLTGAIITERAYSVPGVGNLLTTAINSHDNAIIVACTLFYTALSIISLIWGDLLLAKYDPRITLSDDATGGR